jgi:putative thioredoxin
MLIGNSDNNENTNLNSVKDVTSENFMEEVVELSKSTPVIVDFWAPWCGPCKELGPNIEKAVNNANGKVVLAKVNIDENQAIAAQLRVQSIPTVYAFVDGQPVDGFMGAQPESTINEFVKKVSDLNKSGPNIDEMLETANSLYLEKNFSDAGEMFENVLSIDAEKKEAISGYIRSLVGLKKYDAASDFINSIEDKLKEDNLVKEAIAALDLSMKAENASSQTSELKMKIEKNPKDMGARQELAVALYGSGETEAALDCLLESISVDRSWNEEAARKQLVEFFSAIGLQDPIVVSARKRLSSILFK